MLDCLCWVVVEYVYWFCVVGVVLVDFYLWMWYCVLLCIGRYCLYVCVCVWCVVVGDVYYWIVVDFGDCVVGV